MILSELKHGDRMKARQEMIQNGSMVSEVGHCGDDCLPCLVCDECIDQMEECQICRDSIPCRVWPAVGQHPDIDVPACLECIAHVGSGEDGS